MAENESFILQCKNLSKSVTTIDNLSLEILHDINLNVQKSESVAIVGQSGSGKTTLLSLLAGLDSPTSGEILLTGHALQNLDEDGRAQVRNENIGFVFQSFHLLPGFTAQENVMLPLELQNHPDPQKIAKDLLDRVGLGHRLKHYPTTLSGGEQQRVAIARAFATQPPLLMADEPTGNLDHATGEAVSDLLFELNGELQTTLILVTHDLTLSQRCQSQYEMQQGQLIQRAAHTLVAETA